MAKTHYFPSDEVHFSWDAGNAPVLTVESGDTVVVHTRDVSDDQIGPDSTADVTGSRAASRSTSCRKRSVRSSMRRT